MTNGPVETFAWVDDLPKKNTGKRTKVEDVHKDVILQLKDNPGKWAKLLTGKHVTIVRTSKRFKEVFGPEGYEFATRTPDAETKTSELYARWVAPTNAEQKSLDFLT